MAVGAAAVSAALLIAVIVVAVSSGREAAPLEPSAPPAATSPSPDVLEGVELDALQDARLAELRDFTAWLDENDVEGFIGEVGWPADADWEPLAELWYALADQEGLVTTAWAAGSQWSEGYPLTIYTSGDDDLGLDRATISARVVEDEELAARHGVNLAGLEFGTESDAFSTEQPGDLGVDYFAEPEASFAFLAERGIDLVRIPFRWERLQPQPLGEFDASYAAALEGMLDGAAAHGVDVILDLHNYAAFETSAATLRVGTPELPDGALADVWTRIADRWGAHPTVVAYGLMNEPHSLPGATAREAAEQWERSSQFVVDALRAAGDDTLIMVPGYDYSSVPRWRENHPTAWIDDPADSIQYEGHHYWDAEAEGFYELSYAEELALLER